MESKLNWKWSHSDYTSQHSTRKNVNFCLAVGVGHNHETKENLGISALFEKLLLSRTKGIIADYAGTMTYYYLEVPVEKVPDAIAALAEW